MSTNLASFSYTTIETGFTYYIASDSTSWDIYSAQVADTTTYTVVAQDTINQAKFSSFLISHQITTTADKDGVCMISSEDGTVCLLQNAADDGADTYRVNTTKWATAIAAYSANQAEIITNMAANSGAKQDPTATNV